MIFSRKQIVILYMHSRNNHLMLHNNPPQPIHQLFPACQRHAIDANDVNRIVHRRNVVVQQSELCTQMRNIEPNQTVLREQCQTHKQSGGRRQRIRDGIHNAMVRIVRKNHAIWKRLRVRINGREQFVKRHQHEQNDQDHHQGRNNFVHHIDLVASGGNFRILHSVGHTQNRT